MKHLIFLILTADINFWPGFVYKGENDRLRAANKGICLLNR